jgi:hypothetical protein
MIVETANIPSPIPSVLVDCRFDRLITLRKFLEVVVETACAQQRIYFRLPKPLPEVAQLGQAVSTLSPFCMRFSASFQSPSSMSGKPCGPNWTFCKVRRACSSMLLCPVVKRAGSMLLSSNRRTREGSLNSTYSDRRSFSRYGTCSSRMLRSCVVWR